MRPAERFWSHVDRTGECWIWTAGRSEYGYGRLFFRGKARKAHRVAYELTHGPIPTGLFVCHACDNPACVRPDHLWLGTNQDNLVDASRKGRIPQSKLTPTTVREIRAALAAGEPKKVIARRYGVAPHAIRLLAAGRTWAHVA